MFLRAETMVHTAATIFAVACDCYDSNVLILNNVASNNVVANRRFLFAEVVWEVTRNRQRVLRYFFSADKYCAVHYTKTVYSWPAHAVTLSCCTRRIAADDIWYKLTCINFLRCLRWYISARKHPLQLTVLAAAPEKVAAGWLVTAKRAETALQLAVYADTAGMLEITAHTDSCRQRAESRCTCWRCNSVRLTLLSLCTLTCSDVMF